MKKLTPLFKIVFAICFFCISNVLHSQENKSKQNTTAKNEVVLKTKLSTNANSAQTSSTQKQVDTGGKSFQLDENDAYQGRTVEFLSQITLKELPSDFPKYEKWMGIRHYNEAIDDYYKKHLDILTPIVKQKLTQVH